jgi:uncharacterized hydrophobic protein (TIGR00271 family)
MVNNLIHFFDLHRGEDDRGRVLENVKASITFRGANLWILACAIVVASVGLNVNSTAVIIGAMLISPLMGPIVGAGFSLATFDFPLLRKSLKNLLIATLVGLVVSAIYFFISPFKDTQSELLARTSPNIYDIIIAFFGGLVGVIAITRVEKGNPIPGVAIATALMPPLCTAGYGLAVGNVRFFMGALYLYTINCVFICIATFLIVKYLKYPITQLVNKKQSRQVKYVMSTLIIIMLVPATYFAYILFEERKFNERVNSFLATEFTDKGSTIIYKKTRYNHSPKTVELAFLNQRFSNREIKELNKKLEQQAHSNTRLVIRQDTIDIKKDILNEISSEKAKLNEKDAAIANLQKELTSYRYNATELLAEVQVLFPAVTDLSAGNLAFSSADLVTIVVYRSKTPLATSDVQRLETWLKVRLKKENLQLYRVT